MVLSSRDVSGRRAAPVQTRFAAADHVVVAGGSPQTLDYLRLATVRSDDVTLIMERRDDAIVRFSGLFLVEMRDRALADHDLDGVSTLLITIGDIAQEDRAIREARWRGIPVHVANRPTLSDFTMLEFLEHSVG